MGDQSAIEWTEATWNPIAGCSRVSEGCRNCYAERQAIRIPRYQDVVVRSTSSGPRWTGNLMLRQEQLDQPLRWQRPRRIFVNSMSDLFHEKVPDEWIIDILGVIERATQHTFQVLTKRPERMLDFFIGTSGAGAIAPVLPNLWLGVSVEDQATADARIPLLVQTPAAVRWVSYEPALGPVDFAPKADRAYRMLSRWYNDEGFDPTGSQPERDRMRSFFPKIDWIVVGGESGPGARPFDLAWARQTIAQGRAAGVPVFVKQLGASSFEMCGEGSHPGERADHPLWLKLDDRKGGDPTEWPEDLRVREYPEAAR